MKQITDSVFYTGVLNPNMRVFDVIMRTEYGTSYNSYVVRGSKKNALIEAAHRSFFDGYLENISEALAGGRVDYLVLNHCEPDHTGCIEELLKVFPELTIVVSQAGSIYIKNITNRPDANIMVVKDGDSLDLGDKTLQFISAPFLHWPDSMFTWLPEEKVLFTCDFLGCHFCEPMVFDSKIVYENKYWDAVKYYYDCIFGPFAPYVRQGLEKSADLDAQFVCNSHGPVLTKGCYLEEVRRRYAEWSAPKDRAHKLIPLFYCTAYGNTQRLAEAAARGIKKVLPDAVAAAYNIIENDMAEMTALLNESDAFVIGSPTINREAVPPVWQLLAGAEAVNIAKRPALLLGSFGWSGEALPHIAERLASMKIKVFEQQLKVAFVPTESDIAAAEKLGEDFARSL